MSSPLPRAHLTFCLTDTMNTTHLPLIEWETLLGQRFICYSSASGTLIYSTHIKCTHFIRDLIQPYLLLCHMWPLQRKLTLVLHSISHLHLWTQVNEFNPVTVSTWFTCIFVYGNFFTHFILVTMSSSQLQGQLMDETSKTLKVENWRVRRMANIKSTLLFSEENKLWKNKLISSVHLMTISPQCELNE